jgi:Tfp pilus assembly protein PilV
MKNRINQRGFSGVEVVIIIVVLIVVGLLGYVFYNQLQNKQSDTQTTSQQSSASDEISVPAITTASDLDKATETLDAINLDADNSNDIKQLDSTTSQF